MRRFPLLHIALLMLLPFSLITNAIADVSVDSSRCVVDDRQKKVCLKQSAQKIVSLSPGSTELLFSAGAGDRVIAVDKHSNFPLGVKDLPDIGSHKSINVEALLGMQPDLVVIWSSGNLDRLIRNIEDLGLNTLHLDVQDFEGIRSAILRLGTLAGTEKEAKASVADFDQKLAKLKNQYSGLNTVSVFYEVWRDPLLTVNGEQIISKVIELCSGRNIFSGAQTLIPTVSREVLLADNPEVILGSDHQGGNSNSLEEMKAYWREWNSLTAVKKDQIYTLPADLISRPTPRLLQAAEQLCNILQSVRSARKRHSNDNKIHSDEKV